METMPWEDGAFDAILPTYGHRHMLKPRVYSHHNSA